MKLRARGKLHSRRLAARMLRRRRVRYAAASKGGRRSARVPDAGPRQSNPWGRRAAGAVARDSVAWGFARNTCTCRVEETAQELCLDCLWHQLSGRRKRLSVPVLLIRFPLLANITLLRWVQQPRATRCTEQFA